MYRRNYSFAKGMVPLPGVVPLARDLFLYRGNRSINDASVC